MIITAESVPTILPAMVARDVRRVAATEGEGDVEVLDAVSEADDGDDDGGGDGTVAPEVAAGGPVA
jgi:hypothetical protein